MSGRGNKISPTPPKLDLQLNLSPPRSNNNNNQNENENENESAASSSEISSKCSCVSSEADHQEMVNSPEENSSMLLVGCPRCLMYVMLSDVDPKCPKCKSTVLLDVLSNYDHNTCNSNYDHNTCNNNKT